MADEKITELGAGTVAPGDDLVAFVDDPTGAAVTKKATLQSNPGAAAAPLCTGASGDLYLQDLRLAGGLYVGGVGTDPDADDIHYDGNLKSEKAATHDVYAFHPLVTPLTNASFNGDSFSDVGSNTKIENTSWSTVIPAEAKALLLRVECNDSGSGNTHWLTGWDYRESITLDATDVAGGLSNFPVLISFTDADLAHTDSGGSILQSDGADIAFTSDDGATQLKHELVRYEHDTGEIIAWVLVPSLSGSVDTVIYVYYGNADCVNQEQQDLVWDANYLLVAHMEEDEDDHATIKNTSTYDNFGFVVKTGPDDFLWMGRTGADHVGNGGKLVSATYDPTTDTWGAFSDIYDDASYDSRNAAGGYIGGDLYVFFARYNDTTSTWIDMNYIKSTDDGSTWGSRVQVTIDATLIGWSPYGALVKVGDRYYQPYYGRLASTNRKIKLLYTDDDGATWTDGPTIFSGADQYSECSVAYLGDGDMIAIARDNNNGVMRQFESDDDGLTWSDAGDTNMGVAGNVSIPWVECDGRWMFCWYTERVNDVLVMCRGTKDTILGSPTAWIPETDILTGLAGLGGYQSAARWKPNHWIVVVGDEISSADNDLIALHAHAETVWLSSSRNCLSGGFINDSGLPAQVAGQVGYGTEFFETGYLKIYEAKSILNLETTGIFTVEAWLKLDDYTADDSEMVCGSATSTTLKGWFFSYENRSGTGTQELRCELRKASVGVPVIDSRSSDNIITDNNFHHVAASGDATNVTFHVDGVSDAGSNTMVAKSAGDSDYDMLIGANNGAAISGKTDGKIDELRISDVVRSDDWLETCYNNQNDAAGFITVGSEETQQGLRFALYSASGSTNAMIIVYLDGVPNDLPASDTAAAPCTDGDIWYRVNASGTNTLDVYLFCYGYWI